MKLFLALIFCAAQLNLNNWNYITQRCAKVVNDVYVLECESGGIYQKIPINLDQPVSISVNAKVKPIGTVDRFWASFGLDVDIPADNRYTTLAIEKGIAPYTNNPFPFIVQLSDSGKPVTQIFQSAETDHWYNLRIDYANKVANFYIDGIHVGSTQIDLGRQAYLIMLCVAVDPGTAVAGALSHCEFTEPIVNGSSQVVNPSVEIIAQPNQPQQSIGYYDW